jgi:hypothetical protein
MSLDFVMLSLLFSTLLGDDMKRRGWQNNQLFWLFAIPLLAEVLNVKILRIVSKLCIGIGDTKFDQLMTLFSIDNGFYLGKTQRL